MSLPYKLPLTKNISYLEEKLPGPEMRELQKKCTLNFFLDLYNFFSNNAYPVFTM